MSRDKERLKPDTLTPDTLTTAKLLNEIKEGDPQARERLVRRYLPLLNRWAHGRLPHGARDIYDTEDLAQETMMRAMDQLDHFNPERKGALLSYLRTALMNQVRDVARKVKRRPRQDELPEDLSHSGETSLEEISRNNLLQVYETCLQKLTDAEYAAVVLRIEHDYTYQEMADALGKTSWNAARMTVTRALVRLSGHMADFERKNRRK